MKQKFIVEIECPVIMSCSNLKTFFKNGLAFPMCFGLTNELRRILRATWIKEVSLYKE